jgi:hypothetical protein
MQGKIKQEVIEAKEKLTSLIVQGGNKITQTEEKILKEVEVAKVTSQKQFAAWRSRKHD